MIVGVEAQERMLLRSHSQRLGCQLLDRQKKFGFVGKQQIHILPAETHQNIWILEIRMYGFSGAHRVGQREAGTADHQIQELPDARLGVGESELL